MNVVETEVRELINKEYQAACKKFPLYASDHEGAAVMLEEIEEAESALKCLRYVFDGTLWPAVKNNLGAVQKMPYLDMIRDRALNLSIEAIQIAAVAQKFSTSMEKRQP